MSCHIPGWRTKCSHSNIMPRHARNSTPVYRIYDKREWTMALKHKFQHKQVGGPLVFWLQESSRLRDRGVHREICDLWGQGWRSAESIRLPPVWPGFESWPWRHMWVEFVVGSPPCSAKFFSGVLRFSPLLKNQHLQIPIQSGTHGHVSTSS